MTRTVVKARKLGEAVSFVHTGNGYTPWRSYAVIVGGCFGDAQLKALCAMHVRVTRYLPRAFQTWTGAAEGEPARQLKTSAAKMDGSPRSTQNHDHRVAARASAPCSNKKFRHT